MKKHSSAALIFLSLFVYFYCYFSSRISPLTPLLPRNPGGDVSSFVGCLANAAASSSKILYTRSDANFSSVLGSYIRNLQFATPATPKPLAIVTPLAPNHVQAAILCARNSSLQIRIRSGGHDAEGLSYVSHVPFVILDLFNLRDIKIDLRTETAWVQPGATLGELYHAISQKSSVHAFPAGVCFSVGAGGHFTGGGYGNLMRKYGLSVDNIVDATFVDVNGRILDREAMGEDLFWAIRGGGAASFGVVLGFKINLVRVPETVTVFKVHRTLEEGAADAFEQWQQLAADDALDKELFIRVMPIATNTTVTFNFMGMFLGDSAALLHAMSAKFPLLGLNKEDVAETSWVKSAMFWYELPLNASTDSLLSRAYTYSAYLKLKSDYVRSPIPRSGLEALWKKMVQLGGKVILEFNPYGGRMAEISPSETPFPHRAVNLWLMQYSADWRDPAEEAARLDAINQLYDLMTPYVSKSPREAYLNYRDIDIGTNAHGQQADFGYKYFKANFDRLIRIKTAVDPDNFFHYEQSIPTKSVLRQN